MHISQKINIKQRPFIDWPLSIQRILLMMAGILLFLLFNKQLFTTTEQMVVAYKKNTDKYFNITDLIHNCCLVADPELC